MSRNNQGDPIRGPWLPEALETNHLTGEAWALSSDGRLHPGANRTVPRQEDLEGSGGGSSKSGGVAGGSAAEEPNTLRSVAHARVVEGLSEGPIAGFVNGEESIFVDDLPLVESDGSYNFDGFVWEFRAGYPRQSYLSGFPAVESESSVATQVVQATPIVRTITDVTVTSARVRLRFPSLHRINDDTGSLEGTSVEYKIEVRVNGSATWETKIHRTLTGKCVAPYERAYRVQLEEGAGPWDIRVVRVTADSGAATLNNDLYWQATVAVKDHKIEYSDTAVIGVEVSAESFGGGVPRRSYEIYGRIVRVPSNYNPVTRAYSGVWDGNFQLAYTNNPAWCLYDLITHTRYGAAIPQANVDKWSFYAVGTYCDGMVSDGDGGTEPRYTFNGILQQSGDPYEIISAFAASFRAAVYHSSGLIYLTQDSPRDADLLVTPANVVGGMFEYQSDDDRVRHNRALVTWNDPSAGYEARIEPVEDNNDIAVRGVREKGVVAFGTTSRGQAQRFGAWIIELERAGTEVVSYTAGPDHGMVLPGWVVAIADPMQSQLRHGGRLAEVTAPSWLTLDAPFEREVGVAYTVHCLIWDGFAHSVESRSIISAAGTGAIINIASPFSADPSPGDLWVITSDADLVTREYRVLSVNEGDSPGEFVITGMLHDATRYARVESLTFLDPEDWTPISSALIPPPTSLTASEYMVRDSGSEQKITVRLSWLPPDDPRIRFYQVQWQDLGGLWNNLGQTSETGRDLPIRQTGSYKARVRSISVTGKPSAFAEVSFTADGVPDIPPAPTSLTVAADLHSLTVEWVEPDVSSFSHVEIWANTADSLGGAGRIGTSAGTSFTLEGLVPNQTRYFWLRTVTHDPANPYSNYTASVNGTTIVLAAADVPADLITADAIADAAVGVAQLVDDAVTAAKLAADAVTPRHQLVTIPEVLPDPQWDADAEAWSWTGVTREAHDAAGVPAGAGAAWVAKRVQTAGAALGAVENRLAGYSVPVSPGRTYQFSWRAARSAALGPDNSMSVVAEWYDEDSASLSNSIMSFADELGAGAINTWVDFSRSATAPAGAAYLTFSFRLQTTASNSLGATVWGTRLRLRRSVAAEAIEDGAVGTAKIVDAAITAAKVGANQIGPAAMSFGGVAMVADGNLISTDPAYAYSLWTAVNGATLEDATAPGVPPLAPSRRVVKATRNTGTSDALNYAYGTAAERESFYFPAREGERIEMSVMAAWTGIAPAADSDVLLQMLWYKEDWTGNGGATVSIGTDIAALSENEWGRITAQLNATALPETAWARPRLVLNNSVSGVAGTVYMTSVMARVAVDASGIVDAAISSSKLADGSVLSAKLADAAVATAKIADGAILEAKLADASVATAKLADDAVTSAKVGENAITPASLAIGGQQVVADGNLITTSSEYGFSYWYGLNGATFVDHDAVGVPAGAPSRRVIQGTTNTGFGVLLGPTLGTLSEREAFWFPIRTGDQVEIAASLAYTGVAMLADSDAYFQVLYYDADWNYLSQNLVAIGLDINGLGSGTWGRIAGAIPAAAPANAAWAGPRVILQSSSASGGPTTVFATNISMRVQVGSTALADAAVSTQHIVANSITTATIAAGAVTANEILAGTVTATQIAANTITANKIAALTITASELAANSITTSKIAADAVTANEILASTITSNEIAANTITAANLAANSVTASELAADSVTAAAIAAGTITATEIAAGTITATQIAALTITAGNLAANSVNASKIVAGSITANEVATNTLTANEIASGAITVNELAADSVNASKIQADAIDATHIQADAVEAEAIAAGAVTATKLAVLPADLIPDPDFSLGIVGAVTGIWVTTGTVVLEDHDAANVPANAPSTKVLRRDMSTGSETHNVNTRPATSIPIQGGTRYVFSAWYAASGAVANDQAVSIAIQYLDADLANVSLTATSIGSEITAAGVNTWFLAEHAVTAPANAVYARPVMYLQTASAAGSAVRIYAAAPRFTRAVGSTSIIDGSIVTSKIAADAVTANEIAGGTITANELAANSVTATQVQAAAITAGKLAADSVSTSNLQADAVTATKIAADAIDATHISADAITADAIAAGAVTASAFAVLPPDQMPDPEFALGIDGSEVWSGGAGVTLEDYNAVGVPANAPSAKVGKAVADATMTSRILLTRVPEALIPVQGGAPYELSAWWASSNASLPANLALSVIQWFGADKVYDTSTFVSPVAEINASGANTWTQVAHQGTAPADAAYARIVLYLTSASVTGVAADIYVTGPRLVKAVGTTAIVDGAITTSKILAGTVTANEITANTITTDRIAVGGVATGNLATNAATIPESGYSDTTLSNLGTSWTNVATVTYTSNGSPVALMATAISEVTGSLGTPSAIGSHVTHVKFRVVANQGSDVVVFGPLTVILLTHSTVEYGDPEGPSYKWVSDGSAESVSTITYGDSPSSGSITYKLQMKVESGGSPLQVDVYERALTIIETKR